MIGRLPESACAAERTESSGGRAGRARTSRLCVAAAVRVGFVLLTWTPTAGAEPESGSATAAGDDGAGDDGRGDALGTDSATSDAATPSESADALADSASADASGGDAGGGTADARPPYDAGDGLTPLASLPTWGEGDDHDGCSCRSANGGGDAEAAIPWMIVGLAWMRSRRSRGA